RAEVSLRAVGHFPVCAAHRGVAEQQPIEHAVDEKLARCFLRLGLRNGKLAKPFGAEAFRKHRLRGSEHDGRGESDLPRLLHCLLTERSTSGLRSSLRPRWLQARTLS